MPYSTKSYEIKYPKATIPKDSIRQITVPDGITAPTISTHADFVSAFNSTNNSELADTPARIIDVIDDQRYVLMYFMHFAVSIYAALDIKKHPLVTPASIVAYFLDLYHAFHLACDKQHRGSQSRHATAFMSSDSRRDLYFELLRSAVPAPVESLFKLLMPTTDPRRPDIKYVPTYAGYHHTRDFGRFIPSSFMLLAHNVLSTTAANANPSFVTIHWLRQSLMMNGNTVLQTVGNLLGYIQSSDSNASVPDTWFYTAVTSLMTPIVSRTISQRYVFSPSAYTAIDFNEISNLSIGLDGTVNTSYDVNDINPYILSLGCDDTNYEKKFNFITTMSRIFEDAHMTSSSLAAILNNDSNVHLLSCAYISPSLPTWSTETTYASSLLRAKKDEITLSEITPQARATAAHFLAARTFTASTRQANRIFPQVEAGWKDRNDNPVTALGFQAQKLINVINRVSTDAAADTDPDSYVKFKLREHYTPSIRVLIPFDCNPSEAYVPQICGRIIEAAEIAGFSVPYPDSRLSLDHENSFILSSAIPLRFIHPANDLAVTLHDRYLPEPYDEPVTINLYDMSRNRYGQVVKDAESTGAFTTGSTPHGMNVLENVRFLDLINNKISYNVSTENNYRAPTIEDEFIYAWSPYRVVLPYRTNNVLDRILMLVDPRTLYGTVVPLMTCPHPSLRFPKN